MIYKCKCGHCFPEDLGKYGCPNCEGEYEATLVELPDPKNLINWAELSRLLAKDRSSITRTRIPKIHSEEINNLLSRIKEWQDEYV
jgi:hypothetical protein